MRPSLPSPPLADQTGAAERQKSSLLVRKIAKEHSVDLSRVPGTGLGGRVTKDDILGYLNKGPRPAVAAAPAAGSAPQPPAHVPAYKPGDNVEVVVENGRTQAAGHLRKPGRASGEAAKPAEFTSQDPETVIPMQESGKF